MTSPGSDSSGTAILARRFAADGTPVGAEFQVNSTTTGDQFDPAVAVNASGAFAIVWVSADGGEVPITDPACGTGPYAAGATVDCEGTGIRGQLYTSAGVANGSEIWSTAARPKARSITSSSRMWRWPTTGPC